MKTLTFSISVKATPHEVYEALMDSKKHTQVTGDAAKISRKVGGAFSAFGGYAMGKNVTLVEDKKIVQTWRASDWPDKHFSTITFELKRSPRGTILHFTQANVPD